MSVSKESLVGSLIDGRYLIEGEIGVGGMGTIYRARDLKVHGRSVVVKVLHQEAFQNEYVVKKFRQEAEALSRLDHPNIVNIHDFGEMQGGQPYLVLQYVDGVSLRALIQPGGMELARAAHILRQTAYALTVAHAKGILHRDLKPDNIMLQDIGGEERVVVIDFGIAQVQDSVIAPKTVVTATAGTMYYMSPEQLTAGDLTPASDVYSLGVIAYEMLTGEKPFAPKSPFQLLEMQRAGVAVPPRAVRPELPEEVQAAVLVALAFNPEDRFRSTQEFGYRIYRAACGAPPSRSDQLDVMEAGAAQQFGAPPPTQSSILQMQTRPMAEAAPLRAERGNAAACPPTSHPQEPVPVEEPQEPVPAAPPAAPRRGGGKGAFIAVAVVLLLALLGGGAFVVLKLRRQGRQQQTAGGGASAKPLDANAPPLASPTQQVAAPDLTLDYSLTIQMMNGGRKYKEPFESTGREIFQSGWQFRMNVSTPGPGYLYLLNEGLDDRGNRIYTVLFPTNGEARLTGGQAVQVPAPPQYYVFTGETGNEMIWIIWSEQPVPEMEAVKGLVNQRDQGEVRDPAQISSVREFLTKNSSDQTQATEDKANQRTAVKAHGAVLVYRADLAHH